MSGSDTARRVAFHTIRAVDQHDAYANLLLPVELRRARLSAADAALATELTYGTLRAQGTYDQIIQLAARRPIDQIDPPVRDALRLGVHQILATRIPAHAAVNETVALVRDGDDRRAAGFANAVLRRVTEASPEEWLGRLTAQAKSDDEALAATTAHPVWIIRAFRRALAAENRADELASLLAADNTAPRVTMTALPGLTVPPTDSDLTAYSPLGFLAPAGDPSGLVTESNGQWRVQDEGSQLAALALSRARPVTAGERWLDLCAGPGGKTAILAAEAHAAGASLEANDLTPARAQLVRDAVAAVPETVPVSQSDGRIRATAAGAVYDRILVDAPCTGLGALRRRPEARWRKTPADVPELATLQRELLTAAISGLKPGGIVAYVTCSPHLAETAAVVEDVRRTVGNAVDELDARAVLNSVARSALDLAAPESGSGRAQLWPHRHGTDAMFITLLQRS